MNDPVAKSELLTSREMALFVARGFLRFDGLVPAALNKGFMAATLAGKVESHPPGTPLADCYQACEPIRGLLQLPRVRGIIQSLVGAEPTFDHHAIHHCPPRQTRAQDTHADSIIDTRRGAFDIQIMYYPHEVTRDMGGTRYIPGSHFRRINEMAIARYQNILGQQHVVCPAGTLLVMHHGIWHGGGCNQSDESRYMLKIRLNPTSRQTLLWNTDDLIDASVGPRAIFDADAYRHTDRVQTIFERPEKWFPLDESRLETVNRIRFWRYLVGDVSFDSHYWLTRVENFPDRDQSG
jgi:hypothetical protein